MDTKVSIVIPVYNTAPYLRECLDAIRRQTYDVWEAVCIDDGSTDGSGEMLDEYATQDVRIRVLHQCNAGVSAARNRGLSEATGEWVWFVDGDDVISREALANVVGAVHAHPDSFSVAIGCTQRRKALEEPKSIEECGLIRYDGYGDESLQLFFCGAWGNVLRRDALEGLEFLSYRRNEDGLFMLQAYWRGRVHLKLNCKFYYYRERPGSATQIRPQVADVASTFETQRMMVGIMSKEESRHPGIVFAKSWEHLHGFCLYTYSGMFFKLSSDGRKALLGEWLELLDNFEGRYPIRMEWRLRIWLVRIFKSARLAPFFVLWVPKWVRLVKRFLRWSWR